MDLLQDCHRLTKAASEASNRLGLYILSDLLLGFSLSVSLCKPLNSSKVHCRSEGNLDSTRALFIYFAVDWDGALQV